MFTIILAKLQSILNTVIESLTRNSYIKSYGFDDPYIKIYGGAYYKLPVNNRVYKLCHVNSFKLNAKTEVIDDKSYFRYIYVKDDDKEFYIDVKDLTIMDFPSCKKIYITPKSFIKFDNKIIYNIKSMKGKIIIQSKQRHISLQIQKKIFKTATGCLIHENPNDVLESMNS
jgi:hypothetical protein